MKILNNLKIKHKLIFSYSILFSFQIIIMIIIIGIYAAGLFKEQQMESAQTIVVNSAEMLELTLNSSIKNYLRAVAEKDYDIIEKIYYRYPRAEAYKRIREIILSQPVGETGYVAGVRSDGLLMIHPKSEGVNAIQYDFMKKATEMKNGYLEYSWANKGEDTEREKAGYMRYFKPMDMIIWVSTYKSEFTDLINSKDFEKKLLDIKIGRTGYMFVVDGKGEFIIHPKLQGTNLIKDQDPLMTSLYSRIINEKTGRINYTWKNPGETREKSKIMYLKHIESLDWYVCGTTYTEELTSNANKIVILMAAFLVIGIILFTFLSYIISSVVTGPVKSTIDTIRNIISGKDFRAHVEVETDDEVGVLAANFNTLIENISGVLLTTRKSTEKINTMIQSLSSSSQETSATANQQAAAVKEIVSTMEDSDQLAKVIDNKIIEVTRTTENSRKVVEQGFDLVRDSIGKMNEINEANKTTIDGIMFLNEKINNIWEIVKIINGIADQTKIIAFNAELEASAAGEAGKNFQIVATEIRRLADSTVNSTAEINKRITEIQKSSDRLLLTSENGTEKISEGNELSNRINSMFGDIRESAEASTDSTKQISISIKQQVSSFEQILLALRQISEGVDNAAISTKETTKVADTLQDLVINLTTLLDLYKLTEKENSESSSYDSGISGRTDADE
ncbi:MAG: methyl-accepting chemotaxis protein [Spirochaetes bacterium]|nr:methyl-accepting chemotaxis protein [Spirochaetota bacterium]